MGELNNPTPAARATTQALCRSICDAVIADLALPDEVYNRTCGRGDTEDFALQLAQEVTLQAEEIAGLEESLRLDVATEAAFADLIRSERDEALDQLAAVTAARDEACELAEAAAFVIDNGLCSSCTDAIENVSVERIDALRKAGQ